MNLMNNQGLIQLVNLIKELPPGDLKEEFKNWYRTHIDKFSISTMVTNRHLIDLNDNLIDYKKYQKQEASHKLGQELIDKVGTVSTEPTEYGEETRYEIWVIKP